MVHAHRVVDCQNPSITQQTPAIEGTHEVDMAAIDALHAEIARHKQRCAELLSSPSPLVSPLYSLREPGVEKPTTTDLLFVNMDANMFPMQVDPQLKDMVTAAEKATTIPMFDMPTMDAETTLWHDALPLYPIPCYPSDPVEPNKGSKSTFAQVLISNQAALDSQPTRSFTEVRPSAFLPRKERIAVSALQELGRSDQVLDQRFDHHRAKGSAYRMAASRAAVPSEMVEVKKRG